MALASAPLSKWFTPMPATFVLLVGRRPGCLSLVWTGLSQGKGKLGRGYVSADVISAIPCWLCSLTPVIGGGRV